MNLKEEVKREQLVFLQEQAKKHNKDRAAEVQNTNDQSIDNLKYSNKILFIMLFQLLFKPYQ
jgi:hypothetical protein